MNNYELKQQLQNGIVSVVFTKLDGSTRTLKCTLLPEYLPAVEPSAEAQLLTEESERPTIRVWDVENNGWRSFRFDSVRSVIL